MTASENPCLRLASVLTLKPSLAVFDCDGTLWRGDAGEGFFDWELERGIFPPEVVRWARQRYADYRAGKVSEADMCGEMVTLHRGLPESGVLRLAQEFFDANFMTAIFPEMQELIVRLKESGCDIWAVSSTNEWLIRQAMRHFGIPGDRILAAAAKVENDTITERLIRTPTGTGKPKAILEVIGQVPDVAFGNSRWDLEMLALARFAVAVNPSPELKQIAQERAWAIYWPPTA